MYESAVNSVRGTSRATSGYRWKGFIRFDSIGEDLYRPVLIADGRNPERIGKARYTREQLPDVYSKFIESGYSFSHFSVKGSNLVRNWRTGEVLCATSSYLDSILIANSYSIDYEQRLSAQLNIDAEFENYQPAQTHRSNQKSQHGGLQ